MSASPESRSRVLQFQRGTAELIADEVEDIDGGWTVRTPALPAVWWLNHVRTQLPVTYEEGLALCERHPAPSGAHLYVDHEPSGQAMVEPMRGAGWDVEVELYSVLSEQAGREHRTQAEVIEPDLEEALDLMERWLREDDTLRLTDESVGQLLESHRRTWPARNTHRLGVRGPGGELAGVTLLYSDGSVAQVENVYVIPEARGHGYGRALVTHAAALSLEHDHEMTFIVADDQNWPKHLYHRLGFQPVGRTWAFHRGGGGGS